MSGESTLHLSKHVTLLPSGITHEVSIDIIWVLSVPADEGLIRVGHGLQRDLTIDGRYRDSRLSHDKLVGYSMVSLTELSDTPVPLGTIRVRDLNSRVDSTCSTICPLSALYNSRGQLFKLPVTNLAPNISNSRREDCTFSVRAGAWNHWLDAFKERTTHHLGHFAQTSSCFWLNSHPSLINCRVICPGIVKLVVVYK